MVFFTPGDKCPTLVAISQLPSLHLLLYGCSLPWSFPKPFLLLYFTHQIILFSSLPQTITLFVLLPSAINLHVFLPLTIALLSSFFHQIIAVFFLLSFANPDLSSFIFYQPLLLSSFFHQILAVFFLLSFPKPSLFSFFFRQPSLISFLFPQPSIFYLCSIHHSSTCSSCYV